MPYHVSHFLHMTQKPLRINLLALIEVLGNGRLLTEARHGIFTLH